jgi:hypothetical protein
MSVSHNGLSPSADGYSEAERVRWRQAHEVHSLRDMLAVYRQWAMAIAAENTRLHEEIAILRTAAARAPGEPLPRNRGNCRA